MKDDFFFWKQQITKKMTLAGFSQRESQLADLQIRVNSSLTQWIMWLNKSQWTTSHYIPIQNVLYT